MRLTLDTLHIPEEIAGQVPCQVTPTLFTDRMLDVDFDDPDFLSLTHAEQRARLHMKHAAEQRAVAACQACPMVSECRDWAMRTHVFGVAGAMTQSERARACGNVAPEYAPVTERGPRGQVRTDVIARWSEQGMTTRQMSDYLQASPRTVARHRRRLHGAEAPARPLELVPLPAEVSAADIQDDRGIVLPERRATPAATAIDFDRVSPETLAMYRALGDGAVRSREEVLGAAASQVDDATAARVGARLPGDDRQRLESGRRKFLMNRMDIAVRRGRMHLARANGTVVVWLDRAALDELRRWDAAHSTAA